MFVQQFGFFSDMVCLFLSWGVWQPWNVRGLPLSVCHCLAALHAKLCEFNSLMQQNACYRNL